MAARRGPDRRAAPRRVGAPACRTRASASTSTAAWTRPRGPRRRSPATFVQTEPTPGDAATERTEARVLYDREALYVAVVCYASDPGRIVRRLRRRDVGPGGVIDADDVFVEIGSAGDSRTAFSFGVSAAGVQADAVLSDNSDAGDYSWDAVWTSAVAPFAGPDGAGYVVEVRIPFSQLRYDPAAARPWQIQFQRNIAATGERAYWAPFLPDADGYVSRFGILDGLAGLGAPRRVEVVPYASTRLTRADGDAADPFYAANALRPGVGLDAKIGLTGGLTLTATVNPDFGEVEADPAVLNLSQFENRFDERRPFFVESQDLFAFGSTPAYVTTADRPTFFYSRRIGGAPSSFGALYADTPTSPSTSTRPSGRRSRARPRSRARSPAGPSACSTPSRPRRRPATSRSTARAARCPSRRSPTTPSPARGAPGAAGGRSSARSGRA